MALVIDSSSMNYEQSEEYLEEEELEEKLEEKEEPRVDLARLLPSLCRREVTPVWEVMSCHQSYLAKYLSLHHKLLHSGGPLSPAARQLVAVMASARLSCSALVTQHRQDLRGLGQSDWAQGLHSAPEKIRKLSQLNMVLAHRPWQMTRDHVAELTAPGPDSWSLSELVNSIILMCHFHSLASFIQSCVLMEPDTSTEGLLSQDPGNSSEVEELVRKMSRLRVKAEERKPAREELRRTFHSLHTSNDSDQLEDAVRHRLEPDINNFVEDLNFQYVDFAKTPGNYSTFRIQDFSWDEEGFSIIARFDEETAQLLDEKFRTIYNLTYGTMGSHSSIDTSLFRRASWNYIQCVWGIRHDDYDYHEVNELLHRWDTDMSAAL